MTSAHPIVTPAKVGTRNERNTHREAVFAEPKQRKSPYSSGEFPEQSPQAKSQESRNKVWSFQARKQFGLICKNVAIIFLEIKLCLGKKSNKWNWTIYLTYHNYDAENDLPPVAWKFINVL